MVPLVLIGNFEDRYWDPGFLCSPDQGVDVNVDVAVCVAVEVGVAVELAVGVGVDETSIKTQKG